MGAVQYVSVQGHCSSYLIVKTDCCLYSARVSFMLWCLTVRCFSLLLHFSPVPKKLAHVSSPSFYSFASMNISLQLPTTEQFQLTHERMQDSHLLHRPGLFSISFFLCFSLLMGKRWCFLEIPSNRPIIRVHSP